jgi:hypothetical protein
MQTTQHEPTPILAEFKSPSDTFITPQAACISAGVDDAVPVVVAKLDAEGCRAAGAALV